MMIRYAPRIGAIFYALWGLLHIVGAGALLQQLSSEGAVAVLATLGSGVPIAELSTTSDRVTSAVLAYHAWNILWGGLFVLVIAILFNWKNRPIGYWLNMAVVGAIDLGLLFTHLLPGIMRFSDGWPGLVLWVLAAIFATIGLLNRNYSAG